MIDGWNGKFLNYRYFRYCISISTTELFSVCNCKFGLSLFFMIIPLKAVINFENI